MHQDHQPSKPFDDFRNIEVGLARVIYEGDSWYGLTGWRIPGGRMTQDRDEAHRCAVAMNTLMGGVEVMREPQTREFKTIRPDLSDPAPLMVETQNCPTDWAVGVITRSLPADLL